MRHKRAGERERLEIKSKMLHLWSLLFVCLFSDLFNFVNIQYPYVTKIARLEIGLFISPTLSDYHERNKL